MVEEVVDYDMTLVSQRKVNIHLSSSRGFFLGRQRGCGLGRDRGKGKGNARSETTANLVTPGPVPVWQSQKTR